LLLKAAASVQREGCEFSLLLVGSGPEKPRLEVIAKDLNLKNVRFESVWDPLRVSAIYRSADVLIFPTLRDVWGLVANEAMLCGLPVLCSRYAGCAVELFPEESIFDPQDADEFALRLRDAIAGRLPKPDHSRLRPTPEIVNSITSAVENSIYNYRRPLVIAPVSRG
jgi:glycosyltransferase involved in cell wall biosynthesis